MQVRWKTVCLEEVPCGASLVETVRTGAIPSTDLASGLLAAEVAMAAWSLTSSSSPLSLLRIFAPFCASSHALAHATFSAGVEADRNEAVQRFCTLNNSTMLFPYTL